jgi:hypothetical protein
MQIPTNFSAAHSVSIASQVSSRDKDAAVQAAASTETTSLQASLEQSHSASADRDAQGQGDGLGEHARKQQDENEVPAIDGEIAQTDSASIPAEEDEPPTLFDLVC